MLDLNADPVDLEAAPRSVKRAMITGWRGKCPNCETGTLFKSYLAVQPECSVCGEELHHQRADDGPAYITILVCGHLIAPVMHLIFVAYRPNPTSMIVGFSLGFLALALWMLPRVKGALIGLQWANKMHGFGKSG